MPVDRITSIILSRFILDLRQNAHEHQTSAPNPSTIRFSERVEDGLGGSLNTIFRDDRDDISDNSEDDEDLPVSEHLSRSSPVQQRT